MCEARKRANPRWFIDKMKAGGEWDYKTRATSPEEKERYENFGNFNYGAVSTSYCWIGLPSFVTMRFAGFYQQYGTPENYSPTYGKWWGWGGTYGDRAVDQKWIDEGIAYSKCGCDQKTTLYRMGGE